MRSRRKSKVVVYVLSMLVILGIMSSCASTKKNSHSERPKKGKMKPCDCPHVGLYKKCYDANSQFC